MSCLQVRPLYRSVRLSNAANVRLFAKCCQMPVHFAGPFACQMPLCKCAAKRSTTPVKLSNAPATCACPLCSYVNCAQQTLRRL
ncbi:hypothetical protein GOP47_0016889 [Adiantum capillus-veneris]|uniref:Uncharacterized protein n=1 Tax=Adiantum capillus-veneris TaxID=13818 RepID=A0A9D4ZB50_ADICA|nr:hypothetical protein GOP47_0016889 [Adiantum capillus-veneris]